MVDRVVSASDGRVRLLTKKVHPQAAVKNSQMKLALNFTEAKVRPSRELENDENLAFWCEEACSERSYFEKKGTDAPDDPGAMDVRICDKCFEVTKVGAGESVASFVLLSPPPPPPPPLPPPPPRPPPPPILTAPPRVGQIQL